MMEWPFIILVMALLVTLAIGQCPQDLKLKLASYSCNCITDDKSENVGLCLNTNITEIPQDLPGPLYGLHIENNTIPTINNIPYPKLIKLLLQNNQITNVNGAFANLVELQVLNLANNSLRVEKDIFTGLTSLVTLTMDGNALFEITNMTFSGTILPSLEHLNLADCRIYETEHLAFYNLEKLQFLNISHNRLSRVVKLHNAKALYVIDLSFNRINDLSDLPFDGLEQTTVLHLSHNQLTTLPEDAFKGLSNLRRLYISDNQLSSVHENAFDHSGRLGVIQLDHNNLETLTINRDVMENLETLKLHHNRWRCDCHVHWIRDNNMIKQYNPDDQMICLSPKDLAGQRISAVDEHIFDCPDPHHGFHSNTVALAVGLLFAVTIVIAASVLLYRFVSRSKLKRRRADQPSSIYSRVDGSREIIIDNDRI